VDDDALRNFLGPLEREAMQTIWDADGTSTVQDVLDVLNQSRAKPLAYTTVMSVLVRLTRKGFLERSRDGRAYDYWPVTDPPGAVRKEVSAHARELLDDYGELALSGFIDGIADDPDMLATLQRIIDERESS
jgi:predicted transcriptional regulator